MVVFALPTDPKSDEANATRELLKEVGKVVKDGLGGWAWEGVGLCLGIGEIDDTDEWEDCAAACGLEFVQVRAQGSEKRNEFGGKCPGLVRGCWELC
jgi:alpha- and gamma-adaptin-binding protein p34